MRLASQVDHRLMPRLLVVLFAFAQLHSTAAFALVMRPTLPLAKAKSMRAELRMAESSSDPGLKFFQAGVLPTVAAQLGCTALVVAATLHPGPLHDFAPLWHLFPPFGGSQVAQSWASANPAFWLRWGLWFGCLLYFYSQLELEVTTTDADVSSATYSATEVEPVDIGPSKSLPLGGFTVVQSWFWAVQASWWTAWCLERSPEFLSSVINLTTCFSVLLLLGLATYALIIGPEFPAASRLAVDKTFRSLPPPGFIWRRFAWRHSACHSALLGQHPQVCPSSGFVSSAERALSSSASHSSLARNFGSRSLLFGMRDLLRQIRQPRASTKGRCHSSLTRCSWQQSSKVTSSFLAQP